METKRKLLAVKQPFTEVHISNLETYTYPKQVSIYFVDDESQVTH